MVDVSEKAPTKRNALSQCKVKLNEEAFKKLKEKSLSKGDAISIAEVAGIMGAKQTSNLCHSQVTDKTGCEMESMMGVSIAALTVYDMCKAIDKKISITDIKLLSKRRMEMYTALQSQIKNELLQNQTTECADAYYNIMNSINSHQFQTIFVSSGKTAQDLGNYQQCIRDSSLKYALVSVQSKSEERKKVLIGLCVPDVCDAPSLSVFNKMYTQLVIISGLILDPKDPVYTFPQSDIPSIGLGSIIVIIIMILIFGMTIAGFFVENKQIGNKDEGRTTMVDKYEEENPNQKSLIENRKKKWAIVLYSFSITKNFNEIFFKGQRSIKDKNFEVLNGLKVILLIWIMLGTSYLMGYQYGTSNRQLLQISLNYFFGQIVVSCDFAITMFYFLSAFILTFASLKKYVQSNSQRGNAIGITDQYQKQKIEFHRMEIAKCIVKRFLRLLFPTVLILFFTMTLFKHMGNGPAFTYLNENNLQHQLRSYWYTYIIFLSNLIPWDTLGGFFWVTFIANDLILYSFILIPCIYLYQESSRRKITYIGLWVLIFASILYVIIESFVLELSTMINLQSAQNYNVLYRRPFGPLGYYALGIYMSISYYEYSQAKYHRSQINCRSFRLMNYLQQSKKRCTIVQLSGIFLLLTLVFIRYSCFAYYSDPQRVIYGRWPVGLNAFFNGLSHYLLILSTMMIFLPVFLGKLSIIRDIFASSFFIPLARVGFTASVLQGLVLTMIFFNEDQAPYFDNKNMLFIFFSLIFLVYIISIPIALIFEYPFRSLTKNIVFPPRKIMKLKRDLAKHLKSRNEQVVEEEERIIEEEEKSRKELASSQGKKGKRVKKGKNLKQTTHSVESENTNEKYLINKSLDKEK